MALIEALPLLRLPAHWPLPVVATACMVALAGLDLFGAYAAKEWAEGQRTGALVGGVVAFVLLFWVYASSLQYAELAVVTMGWIVLLQVGIIALDWFHYGTSLPTGKLAAVVVILAAQGYLVLGPTSTQV